MRKVITLFLILLCIGRAGAGTILIPMDDAQKDHLKSYGLIFWVLKNGGKGEWLLNYRGGSFSTDYSAKVEDECKTRRISYEVLANGQYDRIKTEVLYPESNMDLIKLEKAPKIAVYSPKTKQPWDDAVTMVLTYAEIPYDVIYDDDVLANKLPLYDWIHLHHEDFTGQYGKFWGSYKNAVWYQADVKANEETAARWGYAKVSQLKLAVIKKIRDFVLGGGYMFAMCSATDSYDIGLAAEGVDICSEPFDGDAMDPQATQKLDYGKTFAFKNFTLVTSPYEYEFSNIDVPAQRPIPEEQDFFTLFEFSAKTDPIATMLCQNHTRIIKGFMGQTTAFRKEFIKPEVLIMGENKSLNEAKYIHGEYGKGMWTFYGGHDPEDYQHMVGEPPTDLSLHPNSPGFRLILNNVLFPAAKKKKPETYDGNLDHIPNLASK